MTKSPMRDSAASSPQDAATPLAPSEVLAMARARLNASLALLASLVEHNSHADNAEGLAACQRILRRELEALGFEVEEVTSAGKHPRDGSPLSRRHLIARTPLPEGRPVVLLMGHLDTVFPVDHPFQKLTQGEGRWRGPGVSDMKGGIVTALLSLSLLKALGRMPLAGWRMILNADEEQGSPTGLPVLERSAEGAHLALCFEAARPGGGLVVARKGIGSARVVAHGKTGHAGIAHDEGVNALTSLARFLLAAEALEARFPGVTVSPGGAVSVRPQALNAIPDHAECEVEWRFFTPEAGEAVLEELRALAERLGQEAGAPIEFLGQNEIPPMHGGERTQKVLSFYVEAARALDIPGVEGVATAGVGDINQVARLGAVCLDGVGPEGAGFHTEDEHLDPDSIARRAAMNAVALTRYLESLENRSLPSFNSRSTR